MIYYHGDIDEDLSFCTNKENLDYEARNFILDGEAYYNQHLRNVEGGDTTLISGLARDDEGNDREDAGESDVYKDTIEKYDVNNVSYARKELADAVYVITRVIGDEVCITNVDEAREGECVIETRYFDKNLNMIGYEKNVEDAFQRYYFSDFGNTNPIVLPAEEEVRR